jgi:superfamily II DNA or RNA helicase
MKNENEINIETFFNNLNGSLKDLSWSEKKEKVKAALKCSGTATNYLKYIQKIEAYDSYLYLDAFCGKSVIDRIYNYTLNSEKRTIANEFVDNIIYYIMEAVYTKTDKKYWSFVKRNLIKVNDDNLKKLLILRAISQRTSLQKSHLVNYFSQDKEILKDFFSDQEVLLELYMAEPNHEYFKNMSNMPISIAFRMLDLCPNMDDLVEKYKNFPENIQNNKDILRLFKKNVGDYKEGDITTILASIQEAKKISKIEFGIGKYTEYQNKKNPVKGSLIENDPLAPKLEEYTYKTDFSSLRGYLKSNENKFQEQETLNVIYPGRIIYGLDKVFIPEKLGRNVLILENSEKGPLKEIDLKTLEVCVYDGKTSIANRRYHSLLYVLKALKKETNTIKRINFCDDNLQQLHSKAANFVTTKDKNVLFSMHGHNPLLPSGGAEKLGNKFLSLVINDKTEIIKALDVACISMQFFGNNMPCEDYFFQFVLEQNGVHIEVGDRANCVWTKQEYQKQENGEVNDFAKSVLDKVEDCYRTKDLNQILDCIDRSQYLTVTEKTTIKELYTSFFMQMNTTLKYQYDEHIKQKNKSDQISNCEVVFDNTFNVGELITKYPLRENIATKLTTFLVDKNKRLLEIVAPTGIGKGVCLQGFIAGIKKEDSSRILLVTPRSSLVSEFTKQSENGKIDVASYYTYSDRDLNDLFKNGNNTRNNMIFCGKSFTDLLTTIYVKSLTYSLRDSEPDSSMFKFDIDGEIKTNFFKDYTLVIDEYHLLSKSDISLLKQLILKDQSTKLVCLSASPITAKIDELKTYFNSNENDSLSITIQEAVTAQIIRPYQVLVPKKNNLDGEEITINYVWDNIQAVLNKKYFGTLIKEQKVIVYVPMGYAKFLTQKISELADKEKYIYYNLIGEDTSITYRLSQFNNKDLRKGIAICYGRLREGSNSSPNVVLNFQKTGTANLMKMAGRLCRKLTGEEEKQGYGLFINFGNNLLKSTITLTDHSPFGDFSEDYTLINEDQKLDNSLAVIDKFDFSNELDMDKSEFDKSVNADNEMDIDKFNNDIKIDIGNDNMELDNFQEIDAYLSKKEEVSKKLEKILKELEEINNKMDINPNQKEANSLPFRKKGILIVKEGCNFVGNDKTSLRDNFYKLVPFFCDHNINVGNQEDASEFLIQAIEIAFWNKPVTETSSLKKHDTDVINKEIVTSSIIQIPIDDNVKQFSAMISNYQKEEEVVDNETNKGVRVSGKFSKKSIVINIPTERTELVMCVKRFSYKGGQALKKDDDITFDTLTFNTNKYEVTAFIEHIGKNTGGHYITYVKESSGEWFSYNDEKRESVTGVTLADKMKKAYIVKYATKEAELPIYQTGTPNFNNECWLNASLAFINSLTSIKNDSASITNLIPVLNHDLIDSNPQSIIVNTGDKKDIVSTQSKEMSNSKRLMDTIVEILELHCPNGEGKKNKERYLGVAKKIIIEYIEQLANKNIENSGQTAFYIRAYKDNDKMMFLDDENNIRNDRLKDLKNILQLAINYFNSEESKIKRWVEELNEVEDCFNFKNGEYGYEYDNSKDPSLGKKTHRDGK